MSKEHSSERKKKKLRGVHNPCFCILTAVPCARVGPFQPLGSVGEGRTDFSCRIEYSGDDGFSSKRSLWSEEKMYRIKNNKKRKRKKGGVAQSVVTAAGGTWCEGLTV